MSFWSDVGDVVGIAFDWLNENETAADFITGAAHGDDCNGTTHLSDGTACRDYLDLKVLRIS